MGWTGALLSYLGAWRWAGFALSGYARVLVYEEAMKQKSAHPDALFEHML